MAGPPCPPWAGQGKKEGTADLVKCNDLFGVLLENVKGILAAVTPEIGSFMDHVLAVLQAEVPEMHWRIQVLQATDFRLPQQRTRVFLCGARKTVASCVPDALPPLGPLSLRLFLKEKVPCVQTKSLTANMQKNLKDSQRLDSRFMTFFYFLYILQTLNPKP